MSKLEYFKQKIEATYSPMDYMRISRENPGTMALVDVRNTPGDKLGTKIAGALLIPQAEIADRLSEIPSGKTILVYGWDVWCNLGARAAVTLLENGYDAVELGGGIAAWKGMELPLEEIV